MKKILALGLLALPLAGCNSQLTPNQLATLGCYVLSDGTTIAAAFATGGAASTVQKLSGVAPVACTSASNIAAVVSTPAQAKAAVAAAQTGASPAAAVASTAAVGK